MVPDRTSEVREETLGTVFDNHKKSFEKGKEEQFFDSRFTG